MCCRPPCLRAYPSRKHFGRALCRSKIALSLGASSKSRRPMLVFDEKKGDLGFTVKYARGVRNRTGRADSRKSHSRAGHPQNSRFCSLENCAPAQDIRVFCFSIVFISSKVALPRGASLKFVDLCSSNSKKMTLPCGAFGKFGSFMNDDVEEAYTNSIPNESWCTSFEVVKAQNF